MDDQHFSNTDHERDTYGVFKDAAVYGKTLELRNFDMSITLSPGSTIPLMDNLYLVVNGQSSLEYYPMTVIPPPQKSNPPIITGFEPVSPVSDVIGVTQPFNITLDQVVNVSWFMNGTLVKLDECVKESNYSGTSAVNGTWNVTVIASNANGTATQTWIWIVNAVPAAPTQVFISQDLRPIAPIIWAFPDGS